MDVRHLEDYISTAPVIHAARINRGGGHQDKQLVVLDGGVGVVAKLAEGANATAHLQIRAERAAWLLAQELGWRDLVPLTAFRVVQSIFTENYVSSSVQVAWPLFKIAAESPAPGVARREARDCPDEEIWRIAIFDVLALNTDRNGTNWGFIEGMSDRPKLIDHGHAFEAAQSGSFEFIDLRRGGIVPAEHRERVEGLLERRTTTPLADVLPPQTFQHVMDQARSIVDTGNLPS